MKWLARLLGGGLLDRILDTVDKRVDAATDREKIKADIIVAHMQSRPDFMATGGFWLMLLFAAPLALYFASVVVYSMLWCQGCAYPQTWTIAALPAPLDDWGAGMMTAIFGIQGLTRFARR